MLLRTIPSFKSLGQLLRLKSVSVGIRTESNLTRSFRATQKENSDSDSKRSEILSRTRIVVDEKECKKIVESLVRAGEPVAVDMEVRRR